MGYEDLINYILVKEFIGNHPLFDKYDIIYYEITDGDNSIPLSKFLEKYTNRIIGVFKECLHEK